MKLHVLEFGRFPDGPPIPGYLIEAADGRRILVDTGLRRPRPGSERDAVANHLLHQGFGETDAAYTLDVDGTQLVLDELARVGAAPEDIDIVVQTHLDFDHSGNLGIFRNADVAVQRAAYWFAQSDASMRSWPAKWANLPHRVSWRLLDGDTTIAPGVEILETSGHVPGHQSVLIHLPGGAVLLTGDAVFDSSYFHADRAPHYFDITAESVACTRKLLDVVEAAEVREVLFGHDPGQWPRVARTTLE